MGSLFWIFAVLNVANGLWMLLAPESWYHHLPAGVPDTGPFNHHFVQDIGAAFLTIGVAFAVAAARPAYRRGVLLAAALFFTLHAVVHVADLCMGRLHGGHWLLDLPGVFLPAILLLVLSLPMWWHSEGEG
jgi:hypothetical protein